ncbi:MAG: DUF1634 domain-containing protein [Gammaproteobacteria bacterium]|nr:DUF1634 domain-containing protein [Gammaproteobacteria bacterium]
MPEPAPLDELALERVIGRLLRAGVLLSALLVAVGAVLLLWRHGLSAADFGRFRGEPRRLRQVGAILDGARRGSAHGVIQLGLLVLIATPVLRVAFAGLAFRRAGDRLYFGISLWVLGVLLLSLLFMS